jgi:hypothetical protein
MLSMAKLFKSPRPIKTYQVKVAEGKVMVESDKMPAAVA